MHGWMKRWKEGEGEFHSSRTKYARNSVKGKRDTRVDKRRSIKESKKRMANKGKGKLSR